MSEQPAKGNEDKPAGYEPPQYVPPAEFSAPNQGGSVPPPPSYESTTQPLPPYGQDAYTQNAQGQSDFYTQPSPPSSSYTPGDYSQQPPSPYNQPASPYSQPPSPYQQQPYGQPNPYGQPAYYAMPSQPKGLSIASMICGIATLVGFGFFILPQIAAVVLGHLGLKREPAGKGMAIAGLVMGYIGVALALIWIIFIVVVGASSRYNY